MKDMNWPERVAYLENQLADSDRDNRRLREFIEGLPDGDEIVRLRAGLQLIADDTHRLMNEVARQTAASILGGKPVGAAVQPAVAHSLLREATIAPEPKFDPTKMNLVVTRTGVPVADQRQGVEDFKAACLRATDPTSEAVGAKLYRLEDKLDKYRFMDFDARDWNLIVVPARLKKESPEPCSTPAKRGSGQLPRRLRGRVRKGQVQYPV